MSSRTKMPRPHERPQQKKRRPAEHSAGRQSSLSTNLVAFAPAGAKKVQSFSSATCAAKKILLRLQVWNLCAGGAQIMRAADCTPPCQKVILFDSISRRPAEHSAGRRPFFIRYHKTISSVPAPMSRQPIRDLGVKRSCKNTNASTSVMTTLSLSIGTTFDASPICSAR